MTVNFYNEVEGESRFAIFLNGEPVSNFYNSFQGQTITIDLDENPNIPEGASLYAYGEALEVGKSDSSSQNFNYVKGVGFAGTYNFFQKIIYVEFNFYPTDRKIKIDFAQNQSLGNVNSDIKPENFKQVKDISSFYKKNKERIDFAINNTLRSQPSLDKANITIPIVEYKDNHFIQDLEFKVEKIDAEICELSLKKINLK